MPISSLELAKLCGVSQGTVDRALHDRPGVSAKTRERILAVAREHGYQPNPTARELMTGESRLVGAVVPAVNSVFFMDLMNAVKDALTSHGLRLLLTPVADAAEFRDVIAEFAARRMRAAVVVPPEDGVALGSGDGGDLPIVSLLSPCSSPKSLFLAPNEIETGRAAVVYLASLGHRRIVHLTYSRRSKPIRERRAGYDLGMNAIGGTSHVLVEPTPEEIRAAITAEGATAFFCHNDWLALSLIRTLETSGIRVPDDVSVLGVDNSPTFAALCPGLATMAYPYEAIGRMAAEWIVNGREPAAVPVPEIVERGTVSAWA